MATLLHDLIDDIRTLTHNPSYRLHNDPLTGLLILSRTKGDAWQDVSPWLSDEHMHTFLLAYARGLEDGYITAKRGH